MCRLNHCFYALIRLGGCVIVVHSHEDINIGTTTIEHGQTEAKTFPNVCWHPHRLYYRGGLHFKTYVY